MNCGEFIGELFRARDILHIAHLQSNIMAEHMVLEELYDEVLDEVDEIAELRLARGPVKISIKSVPSNVNVVAYLKSEFVPMVDAMKELADSKGFNDIGAEVDELKSAVMRTLYKLNNLVPENRRREKVNADDMSTGGLLYKKNCGGGKMRTRK